MIKLKVTKFEMNPSYKDDLQAYEKEMKESRWNGPREGVYRPEPQLVTSILEVEVTEEQWEAIRKSVMEKF